MKELTGSWTLLSDGDISATDNVTINETENSYAVSCSNTKSSVDHGGLSDIEGFVEHKTIWIRKGFVDHKKMKKCITYTGVLDQEKMTFAGTWEIVEATRIVGSGSLEIITMGTWKMTR